jgi:putative solute:sodium symporter small subunit
MFQAQKGRRPVPVRPQFEATFFAVVLCFWQFGKSQGNAIATGNTNQRRTFMSTMLITDKHREYWSKNLKITGILLFIWFVATFVMGYYARELAEINFFGWPLSFYMGAQGSLIIYVLIIWYYARAMGKLDEEFGVAESDE